MLIFGGYLIDKALHLIVLFQLTKMMHKMLRYIEDLTWMLTCYTWADPEGEDSGFGPPPQKNHKAKGFLSNTCPDLLKIAKLPSQHSMLGHRQPGIEMPCNSRFAGVPMMAYFQWYLDPLSPHQQINVARVGPPLTKFSGSAHVVEFIKNKFRERDKLQCFAENFIAFSQ